MRKIHLIEVSNYALFDVVATVNVQRVAKHSCCVIRSTSNVFALYFDLSPTIIERVVEISIDDEVGVFFLHHSGLVAEELLRWVCLHYYHKI